MLADIPETSENTALNQNQSTAGLRGSITDFGMKMKVTLGEGGNTRTSVARLAFRTSAIIERSALAGFGIEHDDGKVHVENLIPNNENDTIEDDAGEDDYDGHLVYNLITNLEAVLQAVPGLFFFVVGLSVVNYHSASYPQYHHSILCGVCLNSVSIMFLILRFSWFNVKKTLVSMPTHLFLYCAVLYVIPLRMWMSSILNTLTWGISMAAPYPIMKTKDSFFKCLGNNIILAFVLHQSVFIYIWILVVPVLTLEQQNKKKSLSFFTGCLLPFFCFVYGKAIMSYIFKQCKIQVKNGSLPKEKFWSFFSTSCNMISVLTKFPTVALMYANKDKRFAVFTAFLSNLTELAGKLYSMYYLDKTLNDYFIALSKSESETTITDRFNIVTQDAGVREAAEGVTNDDIDQKAGLSDAGKLLYEAKRKEMLKTMAATWQGSIGGEKTCYLLGGAADLYIFNAKAGEDPDYSTTAELTAIFFCFRRCD